MSEPESSDTISLLARTELEALEALLLMGQLSPMSGIFRISQCCSGMAQPKLLGTML